MRDLVLGIYDAVADDSLWPDVLQRIATRIGAVGCIVFEWHGTGPDRRLHAPIVSSYYDPAEVARYVARCFEHEARDQDVFEAHSLRSDGIDLIDDTVLAPTPEALGQLPNVQVLQKLGILHRAAGLLNKDNVAVSRFSVQLGRDRGPLNATERSHLAELLPHVAKALDLGRPAQQLGRARLGLLAAMDRLTIGVCILSAQGRVVARNAEFRRQQDSSQVFRITPQGELRLRMAADQARFEALKSDALHHGRFGARPRKEAVSGGDGTYLCVELVPLNRSEEIGSGVFGGFALYSTDTRRPVRFDAGPLAQVFGLTGAEQDVTAAIAQGLTNAQIATARGRAVATVNAQVNSILSKTGCTTRTQFVRLLTGFGTSFLDD